MIVYFTKQYQAIPALIQLYNQLGGIFVSTRTSTIRTVKKVYPDLPIFKLNEYLGRCSKAHGLLERADLIVTGSPNREILSRYKARKCMVFHGTYAFMAEQEIKGLEHFDIICAIGPRMMESLDSSGLGSKTIASGYLPFLGFPKSDAAFKKTYLSSNNLAPENKTLVYLPRGKPYGSWDVMAEKLLKLIPSSYNLILRPHPSQSVTARVKDKLGFVKLGRIVRRRGNALLDLTELKLADLLSIADLVITDGASSPEEALFYELPLLFIESAGSSPTAIASMMRKKGLSEEYIDKLLNIYRCGRSIRTENQDLVSEVETAIRDKDLYSTARKDYFQWVFGDADYALSKQQELLDLLRPYASPA